MNRVQLVQVIIVIAAVIIGYQTIYFFGFFVANAVSSLLDQRRVADSFAFSYGVMALLYAVSMFIMINNASKLSFWLAEKVQLDEDIKLGFTDRSVLYAVLLFLTLGSLLKNIPAVIYQIFELFRRSAGGGISSSSNYMNDPFGQINYPQWIEAILSIILLFNLKPVVSYFHSKINPEDPHAIETEEEPTNN